MYDFIVVGAGISGLCLAQKLSENGKKVLILEKNMVIGGNHKVIRVDNLFTEHSPRVYLNSYLNFETLIESWGYKFDTLFTPHKIGLSKTIEYIIKNMPLVDIIKLYSKFFYLIFNENYGKNIPMKKFMIDNNFEEKSIDIVNEMCLLTDGCSSDRYSLNKFLQLTNQLSLYNIYQPRKPNDKGLFKIWEDYLLKKGVVIEKNVDIYNFVFNKGKNMIDGILYRYNNMNDKSYYINSKNIILAIPPKNIYELLIKSNIPNAFGNIEEIYEIWKETKYEEYIQITYHWKNKMDLHEGINLNNGEWGIIINIITNYMTEEISKTVISLAISKTDVVSNHTGKTANESNKDELIYEAFRQMKEYKYNNLPIYNIAIINPSVYKNDNKWINNESAYVEVFNGRYISNKSNIIKNLYNSGMHNGNTTYPFTTVEGSVINSIYLMNNEFGFDIKIKEVYTMVGIIKFISVLLFIIFILFYLYKYHPYVYDNGYKKLKNFFNDFMNLLENNMDELF